MALARAVGVRFPRAVRFFARRGARAQVPPAAVYISRGDRLSATRRSISSPLTEAVMTRGDAPTIPRTVAPLILIKLSYVWGGSTTTQNR